MRSYVVILSQRRLTAPTSRGLICTIFASQVDHNARLTPLDNDRMTPIGRAIERGASKSARYLLQIGKLSN